MKTATEILQRAITRQKRQASRLKIQVIDAIMKEVTPFFWETGYVHGDGSHIRAVIFHFEDTIKVPRGMQIQEMIGFTEDKTVIDDAYGGGMSTVALKTLPIEDLFKIYTISQSARFKKLATKE